VSKDAYTEGQARAYLEKQGCKFDAGKTFTVPRGRIGIKGLGMVDYLLKVHGMVAKYV